MYASSSGAFTPTTTTPENYTVSHDSDLVDLTSAEHSNVNYHKEFAVELKKLRCELGYTPADVTHQIAIRYGVSLQFSSIEEYESLRLDLGASIKLKPILEMWLRDASKAAGKSDNEIADIIVSPSTSINPKRDRKRRTSIDDFIKLELESEFDQKAKPSPKEMQAIALRLGIDRDFIRVWFCNRRQRQKKLMQGGKAYTRPYKPRKYGAMSNHYVSSSYNTLTGNAYQEYSGPKSRIQSASHDITIEVPWMLPTLQDTPTQAICIER